MFICLRQNPQTGLSQDGGLHFSISLTVASAARRMGVRSPSVERCSTWRHKPEGFGHTCHHLGWVCRKQPCRQANHGGLKTLFRFKWDFGGRELELLIEPQAWQGAHRLCRERWMWPANPVGPYGAPRNSIWGPVAWASFAAVSPCLAACPGPLRYRRTRSKGKN